MSGVIASDRVGRDGYLRLRFERAGDRTVLSACRWMAPLQVLAPVALDDRGAVASVLNPTGGLVGGDHLAIDVHADRGAHACVTTPSATRVYRTAGAPVVQDIRLRLGAGAIVEWVPDHTIPFAGSAFRQRIDAEIGDDATLVLVDAFAAGRVARGEAWSFARLESAVSIRDAGGLLLHDRFALDGPTATRWDALGLAEGCPYFGSLVVITDRGIGELVDAVRAMASDRADVAVGAAALGRRGLLARYLARTAPALTTLIDDLWAAARRHVLGLPPLALRKP